MVIRRGQHFIDVPVQGRKRKRTIKNWANFREPGRSWQKTNVAVEAATSMIGSLAPMRQSLRAPLQCSLGDANSSEHQAAASCRLADDPSVWIDIRPLDALSSRMEELSDNAVKFPDVWPKATKFYQAVPHKLLGKLILKEPGHSDTFRYSLDVPDGMHIEFPGDNTARILDSEGIERMHLPAPQGWDSSTVNPADPDGRKSIQVTMKEGNSVKVNGRDCVVVEFIPDKDDLDKAIYPVGIGENDTVQITGTTNIEDNYLKAYSAHRNYNYGGATSLQIHDSIRTTLIRIATINTIPEGTITGFRLKAYVAYGGVSANRINAFIVTDANDWVEGTKSGQQETGSSCWNQCKKFQQDWAGHPILGCGKSIDDFDADPSPSESDVLVMATWTTFVLKPEWPPLWRDAIRAPNGIRLVLAPSSDTIQIRSSEHGTTPLYFEIDYEEAGGSSIAAMLKRKIAE